MKSKSNRSSNKASPWQQTLVTAKRAWLELLQQPLTSLASVVVIATTLVLPLTLFSAASKLENTLGQYSQNPQLIAYLELGGTDSLIQEVSERLLMREDISYIELVPKALGLSQFSEDSGLGDLISELGSNPLPDALLITPLATEISSLQALARELNQDPDIESTELDIKWLIRLQGLVDVINRLGMLIGALSVLAFFLVIGNTISSLIQTSLDEIRIQKLLGATDLYVIKPLIFKGLYYGLSGSIVAILLQLVVFSLLNNALANFLSLYDATADSSASLGVSWVVSLTALSASCVIGAMSAAIFAKQKILTLNPA